jgi:hypothetical protein
LFRRSQIIGRSGAKKRSKAGETRFAAAAGRRDFVRVAVGGFSDERLAPA